MPDLPTRSCTAFSGTRIMLTGSLPEVAVVLRRSMPATGAVLVFDDETGGVIDLDLRGNEAEILERLSRPPEGGAGRYRPRADAGPAASPPAEGQDQKTRGRPKLGVVAREVTLLPRQWDWLAAQRGGASATLRRLVDDARKTIDPRQKRRAMQEAAYRFMQAIAGDLPGYEEAIRALFADDRAAMEKNTAAWPGDLQAHALRLAFGPADPAR